MAEIQANYVIEHVRGHVFINFMNLYDRSRAHTLYMFDMPFNYSASYHFWIKTGFEWKKKNEQQSGGYTVAYTFTRVCMCDRVGLIVYLYVDVHIHECHCQKHTLNNKSIETFRHVTASFYSTSSFKIRWNLKSRFSFLSRLENCSSF